MWFKEDVVRETAPRGLHPTHCLGVCAGGRPGLLALGKKLEWAKSPSAPPRHSAGSSTPSHPLRGAHSPLWALAGEGPWLGELAGTRWLERGGLYPGGIPVTSLLVRK